jgi:hypothetical protein
MSFWMFLEFNTDFSQAGFSGITTIDDMQKFLTMGGLNNRAIWGQNYVCIAIGLVCINGRWLEKEFGVRRGFDDFAAWDRCNTSGLIVS